MSPSAVQLAELMAPRIGSVDPSKFQDELFDLYSIPAFDSGEPELIAGADIGSAKQIVKPGDVMLSRIVPHIRRAWVVGSNRGRRTIASGEWIVFRSDRVHSEYLRHVLVGDAFHREFMQTVAGVGGSLLRARPAHVARIQIPLPPLEEQRRIADILDRADALRAKRRGAITKLETLTQSIFLDMFGDPVSNPKGWPVGKVGDLLESARYGTSEKSGSIGEFPVLRMNNITRQGAMDLADLKFMDLDARNYERYLARDGDVLFNRTNSAELVGKTGIFRGQQPMAYAGYLIRLRTNSENAPEFLWAFLNSQYSKRTLRNMCKSIIGMANINATELQAMKIMRPPLTLQLEFARKLASLENVKLVHYAAVSRTDVLFDSLQHRAFSGELFSRLPVSRN